MLNSLHSQSHNDVLLKKKWFDMKPKPKTSSKSASWLAGPARFYNNGVLQAMIKKAIGDGYAYKIICQELVSIMENKGKTFPKSKRPAFLSLNYNFKGRSSFRTTFSWLTPTDNCCVHSFTKLIVYISCFIDRDCNEMKRKEQ